MKRISKNKIEFDCIVKAVTPALTKDFDPESIECYIQYFDPQDEINLMIRGNYKSEHLQKLLEVSLKMELVKIIIEVKDKDGSIQ